MPSQPLHILLSTVQAILGLITFVLLLRARELRTYWPMLVTSGWVLPPYFLLLYLWHLGRDRIAPATAYELYFYTFWGFFVANIFCSIVLTYTIFRAAMNPLKGLQSLGLIMYYWAAAISFAIAVGIALAPSSDVITPIVMPLNSSNVLHPPSP